MKKIIIFDFDGVMVDTFQLCFGISKMVLPELDENSYRERFDGNINETIAKIKPKKVVDFFGEYTPKLMQLPLVTGIAKVVRQLAQNYTLIIISSTISQPIKDYLQQNNLLQHFADVLGNDIEKSKIKKFQMVFERHGINGSDCLMITDTLGDIREAQLVNVPSVAVTWGYHPKETLIKGKPFALVDQPNRILSTIQKM